MFQLSQFLRKSEPKVLVVGSEELAASKDLPPLFDDGAFAAGLIRRPGSTRSGFTWSSSRLASRRIARQRKKSGPKSGRGAGRTAVSARFRPAAHGAASSD